MNIEQAFIMENFFINCAKKEYFERIVLKIDDLQMAVKMQFNILLVSPSLFLLYPS